AHADNRNPLARGKIMRGERRQEIVAVNKILGGVNAPGGFPGQAQLLGALRTHGKHNGGRRELLQVNDGDSRLAADRHMAEIMPVGQAQHLGKLLAQADLHLVLGGINAVFGQAAGLDIAVEDDHFVPALGNLLRGKHSRRPRADYEDSLHLDSSRSSNAGEAQDRYVPSNSVRSFGCKRPVFLLSLTLHANASPSYTHFPSGSHVRLGVSSALAGVSAVSLFSI